GCARARPGSSPRRSGSRRSSRCCRSGGTCPAAPACSSCRRSPGPTLLSDAGDHRITVGCEANGQMPDVIVLGEPGPGGGAEERQRGLLGERGRLLLVLLGLLALGVVVGEALSAVVGPRRGGPGGRVHRGGREAASAHRGVPHGGLHLA